MSPVILVLLGLVIGAAAYALLVRRRVIERLSHVTLARALAASNDIGLARIREASDRRRGRDAAVPTSFATDAGEVMVERRSGDDRRQTDDRRRGRGRRTGGDRRRWRSGR